LKYESIRKTTQQKTGIKENMNFSRLIGGSLPFQKKKKGIRGPTRKTRRAQTKKAFGGSNPETGALEEEQEEGGKVGACSEKVGWIASRGF